MWFSEIFSDFSNVKTIVWIVLAVLLLLGTVLLLRREKWTARMLTYAAVCIALGFILSYIRFFRLPQGGSITPASMLPVMLFSYFFGPVAGVTVGLAYGFLQLLQDFYVTHPLGLLLDYPVAFACLGLAGLFQKKGHLVWGVLFAGFARFLCHFVSGIVFFGSYAPEGVPVPLYSLAYNGSVVGPDLLICLILVLLPQTKRLIERLHPRNITKA